MALVDHMFYGRPPERPSGEAPGAAPFERLLVASFPVAIVACDERGELKVVNAAAEALLGGTVAAGDSAYAGGATEGHAPRRFVLDALVRSLGGLESTGETCADANGDAERTIAVSARGVRDASGALVGAVAAAYDATALTSAEEALRVSEEQLRQSQKMEAVGRLAGGIAHDFNNLLTVITGYSDLLVQRASESDPMREFAEEIRKAGRRASLLTQQLLAFSRKQVLQPKILDLNATVEDMAAMVDRLLGEDVELVTDFDASLWQVRADPGQIVQVAINLAVNSRDAMPDGGTVTFVTRNERLDSARDTRFDRIAAGDYVRFSVCDTGCGMGDDVLEHVFEPFFTTKGVGKGTGLGLATVYGVVRQSGGAITLETEVNKGTSVNIFLPRAVGEVEPSFSSASLPQVHDGSGTILLVEDEDGVRNFVRQTLESAGFTVLTASNGVEGCRVSEEHAGRIDLLLTDVVMPQMSGRELAERLLVTRPETRVLFMSGYTDDAVLRHGVSVEVGTFIQKPFSPSRLVRTLTELLESD